MPTNIIALIAALVRLARAANASEFSDAKQLVYMTKGPAAIAADAPELRTWVAEVEKLARLAHTAGSFDARELLIVESLAAEFRNELDRLVSAQAEFEDEEGRFEESLEGLFDVESQDEDEEVEDAAFWDIVDANNAFADESLEECGCAQCTAANDYQAVEIQADRLRVLLADSVYDLTHEAYVMLSDRGRHPSLRNDPQIDAYASQWRTTFEKATSEGCFALADALLKLTEFTDDVIFALIAKNSPSLDEFSARSAACLETARRVLTTV
jgi:hypothetical protein